MESFLQPEKSEPTPEWVRPDLVHERGEIERTLKDFFNQEPMEEEIDKLTGILENSPIVDLNDEEWEKLENTDSFKGVGAGDIEQARNFCEGYNQKIADEGLKRDFDSLLTAFLSGEKMQCPVIIRNPEGRLHLVSGNTRLMISRGLNIKPKVIIASYL